MKCNKCNKEWSESVHPIHFNICKGIDKKVIPDDWKALVSLAKKNDIKLNGVKKAELKEQLESKLNGY
jgi:hypothetical protein